MDDKDLIKKIKAMDNSEFHQYLNTTEVVNTFFNVVGILLILATLEIGLSVFSLIPLIVLYVVIPMSISMGNTLKLIKEHAPVEDE